MLTVLLRVPWSQTVPVPMEMPLADALDAALQDRIADVPDLRVAVAVRDWTRGVRVAHDGWQSFHAASTMKLAVMIEVFRQAEAERFALSDTIRIRNQFASMIDEEPFAVTTDSDRTLHRMIGTPVPIAELVERMIADSSNLATNLLIDRVTSRAVRATLHRLGAGGMQVYRGVCDLRAHAEGIDNTTTADALATLLERLARGTAVSPEADRVMRGILRHQQHVDGIPAGLPGAATVAHKTGWTSTVQHDAALIEPHAADATPYVLVVLTEHGGDVDAAKSFIRDVARAVHDVLARPADAR